MTRFFTIAAALLLALAPLGAQELKSLPAAPEIKTTELPNGITCYIATNKESKGYADFSLVQQPLSDRQAAVAQARRALVSLPHFGTRRPCDFLSDLGIGYSEHGFVTYQSNATIYDFRRVPMTDQAVADSMLLMLFDIADMNPSPQALIVSGDVDEAKFKDRVRMFSMTVAHRDGPAMKDNYKWTPKPEPTFYFTGNLSSGVATIRVSFAGARTPRAQMNTLQPAVSRQYASYMGTIIENRVKADFKAQGIPLAEVRFRYSDSSTGPSDEQYTISVITSESEYDNAVKRLAIILADLDSRGAGIAELQGAKDRFSNEAARDEGSTHLSNNDYVRRCTAAYLFNSTLASDKTIGDFFKTGRIPIERELELFNNFAAAQLDPVQNVTIGFDTPRARLRTDLAQTFQDTWRAAAADESMTPVKPGYPDSLSLRTPDNKSRVKVKSEETDPISGGSLWTFSNGMKVVYRKTAEKGKFHYAMMLRGGAGLVTDLQPGESAFIGDMLSNCEIAGMHPDEFSSMLLSNGITMDSNASMSDLRIEGTAPSAKLQMVLRSLLSMARDRKPDLEAFAYYKECETLRTELSRMSRSGITEYIDSLLSPTYRYHDFKRMDALRDDLPQRAEEFFKQQFSRCHDGVLVIMGDLEAEALKKELCNHLGEFGTSSIYAARPRASLQTLSGTNTYTVNASESGLGDGTPGVHLAMSVPFAYNMANYMSMKVALIALQRELGKSLGTVGAYAEIESALELFPRERMRIYIHSCPSEERGLPEGISYAEPYSILTAVRSAINRLGSKPLDAASLGACKEELRKRVESELSSDLGRMDAVLMRYSEGKDMVSESQAGINSVTSESVAAAVEALRAGGCIQAVLL